MFLLLLNLNVYIQSPKSFMGNGGTVLQKPRVNFKNANTRSKNIIPQAFPFVKKKILFEKILRFGQFARFAQVPFGQNHDKIHKNRPKRKDCGDHMTPFLGKEAPFSQKGASTLSYFVTGKAVDSLPCSENQTAVSLFSTVSEASSPSVAASTVISL